MKLEVFSKAAGFAAKALTRVKADSPVILAGVGVVGVVATSVAASISTTKLEPVLDEALEHKAQIKEMKDRSTRDKARDYTHLYFRTTGKVLRLYAPAIILGSVTIGSIIGGHRIMHQRGVVLGAAYTALDSAFNRYRNEVTERYGEETEFDIRTKASTRDNTTVVEEREDGSKRITETRHTDPYLVLFDESNRYWVKNAESNLYFIKCVQSQANDRLNARGHVFLNEIFEALGFEHTAAGAVTGWVKDDPNSDGYIDFGLHKPQNADFLNGHERSVWLEFNVDGVMYDRF